MDVRNVMMDVLPKNRPALVIATGVLAPIMVVSSVRRMWCRVYARILNIETYCPRSALLACASISLRYLSIAIYYGYPFPYCIITYNE